ncbi:MAG: hypothetical protein OXG92_00115 [Chloroflexi bacterium]|nr:hypothetical protein [Chloroflexota bacterium]MCY3582602.1 hypothetical protein [Chloroflexota bacterium]MCY3714859.1 hypothetical protein [Chloroflexota bacterium]MDE2651758.1 hypothetical protein [Chloroflexota bacterium]MXX84693.1 hypothetical protein [Chloroflexota bacterium]
MKQFAQLVMIAVLFAALSGSTLAVERNDEEPIFYQAYHVANCSVYASGIGEVSATYLYYWDIAAQANRVGRIMHVSRDLKPGYFGGARKSQASVTVVIRALASIDTWENTCTV